MKINLDKSGGRTQPGEEKKERKRRFWELFAYIDPDLLHRSPTAPPDVNAALSEVMGPDRMKGDRLKLRLHPLLKRWCLFERALNPQGHLFAYRIVSIFHDIPVEGYCPDDLKEGAAHVTGIIGDFRMPTRKDFDIIEAFDVAKYGYRKVEQTAAEPELEAERDAERQFDDMTHDFHYYYWWQAMEDAQQEYGCRGRITYGKSEEHSPWKWKVEQKNGYLLRTRVSTKEEGDAEALKRHREGTRELTADEINGIMERAAKVKNVTIPIEEARLNRALNESLEKQ